MRTGRITKIEGLLLGLTGLFLCGLLTVYFQDRARPEAVETAAQAPQETFMPDVSPLDLNTATAQELARLPGIGEALAARIIAYRAEAGPFERVEEIMEVSGIGEGKFAGLEGRITVEKEGVE